MEKRFHSFAALTRVIFFPFEDKLHMFAPPCNILYIIIIIIIIIIKIIIITAITMTLSRF